MQEYDLTDCPLFTGMTPNEIQTLTDGCVSEIRRLDKGVHVVRQGDSINHMYLLVSGLVRTEMITKEGNVLEIEFIEPIRPLAPAFIYANHNKFPVDVITLEKSVFYIIEKSVWLAEMMQNETLLTNFLKLNSNMTVFLSNKVQMMSIKSLKGKIALYILENISSGKDTFTMKRTQTQLAEYFGVQRPSLARSLGEIINEGIIAMDKKVVKVLDRRRLETLI